MKVCSIEIYPIGYRSGRLGMKGWCEASVFTALSITEGARGNN